MAPCIWAIYYKSLTQFKAILGGFPYFSPPFGVTSAGWSFGHLFLVTPLVTRDRFDRQIHRSHLARVPSDESIPCHLLLHGEKNGENLYGFLLFFSTFSKGKSLWENDMHPKKRLYNRNENSSSIHLHCWLQHINFPVELTPGEEVQGLTLQGCRVSGASNIQGGKRKNQ